MADIRVLILLFLFLALFTLWFAARRLGASARRMRRMMMHHGLDPEIAVHRVAPAVIRAARRRCRQCQFEGHCERWLAGREGGDGSFCANARVFEDLVRTIYA
jgi:hypothetical protein